MFIDIVFPKKNEEAFIERARELGTKGLIFVYENEADYTKLDCKDIKVFSAVIAKNKITNKKFNYLFSHGERQHFENKRVDMVFDLEKNPFKDSYHYRKSGLNHVLCKLAKEKCICIGFSFSNVLKAKNRGLVIGRMMQNMRLCKKYKNNIVIASFAKKPLEMRSQDSLISFGVVLGLNKKQAKQAVLNKKL